MLFHCVHSFLYVVRKEPTCTVRSTSLLKQDVKECVCCFCFLTFLLVQSIKYDQKNSKNS